MAEQITVDYALAQMAADVDDYTRYRNYYEGKHNLKFASEPFRSAFGNLFKAFSYNRCASVVDALSDRLQITGWEVGDDETVEAQTADIWQRNRGDAVQDAVHVESIRCGDAYAIAWPNQEGRARIVAQRADLCRVVTEPETGKAVFGVKCWPVEHGEFRGHWRLTIYEADQISRWITSGKVSDRPVKFSKFIPYSDAYGAEIQSNPYGMVPLIHFPNNALFSGDMGQSELRDVLPLQDGLNKSIADMLVAGEFMAFPQRYVIGLESDPNERPFKPGIDRILEVGNENARMGEFSAADMTQFISAQAAWDSKISNVSRIPVHWLGMEGEFPSGESLKTAESPLVAKLQDRQSSFGECWGQVMTLALLIEGTTPTVDVVPIWQSAEPRSDREFWELAMLKRSAGVPDTQIWLEAGYTQEQIDEFTIAAEKKREEAAAQFGMAFNRGAIG